MHKAGASPRFAAEGSRFAAACCRLRQREQRQQQQQQNVSQQLKQRPESASAAYSRNGTNTGDSTAVTADAATPVAASVLPLPEALQSCQHQLQRGTRSRELPPAPLSDVRGFNAHLSTGVPGAAGEHQESNASEMLLHEAVVGDGKKDVTREVCCNTRQISTHKRQHACPSFGSLPPSGTESDRDASPLTPVAAAVPTLPSPQFRHEMQQRETQQPQARQRSLSWAAAAAHGAPPSPATDDVFPPSSMLRNVTSCLGVGDSSQQPVLGSSRELWDTEHGTEQEQLDLIKHPMA